MDESTLLWPSIVHVAQPAVATDVTFAVPGSEYMRLYAVAFTLTTDANVGTRSAILELLDGSGKIIAAVGAGATQAASLATRYTFTHGVSVWNALGTLFQTGPCPDVPLAVAQSVVIHIDTVKAGDQLSDVILTVGQIPTSGE